MSAINLTNQLLIAMPALADPNFHRTVAYICAHNDEGAMGIVINRPLGLSLKDVLPQMDLKPANEAVGKTLIYGGGPVQTDRGFVLHEPKKSWDSSIKISEDIGMTTSRDILQAITEGRGPQRSLIALGYAGWDAGQREQEIGENSWLNAPCDSSLIFKAPSEKRWAMAVESLGIDIGELSFQAGHA